MVKSFLTSAKSDDGGNKKKKDKSNVKTPYGIYNAIVDDKGNTVHDPTETQSVETMVKYMKNNQSSQTTRPSNVYRPNFSHLGIAYDRKKKLSNA